MLHEFTRIPDPVAEQHLGMWNTTFSESTYMKASIVEIIAMRSELKKSNCYELLRKSLFGPTDLSTL